MNIPNSLYALCRLACMHHGQIETDGISKRLFVMTENANVTSMHFEIPMPHPMLPKQKHPTNSNTDFLPI